MMVDKIQAIKQIELNLGFLFEDIVLIILVMGGLLWFAKDYKLGLILNFATFFVLFLWFFFAEWMWIRALMLGLVYFILMCLSLYAEARGRGGFV